MMIKKVAKVILDEFQNSNFTSSMVLGFIPDATIKQIKQSVRTLLENGAIEMADDKYLAKKDAREKVYRQINSAILIERLTFKRGFSNVVSAASKAARIRHQKTFERKYQGDDTGMMINSLALGFYGGCHG